MKKFVLLLFIMIFELTIFSQNSDRKFLIDITGGYNKHSNEISYGSFLVNSDELDKKITIKGEKVQLEINYKVKDFLYVGVGFEYQRSSENNNITCYHIDDSNHNSFYPF